MFSINGLTQDEQDTLDQTCAEVFDYWRQCANKVGGIPRLIDIDLMDLWPHASRMCILDVDRVSVPGEVRFRWRFAGTLMRELVGFELTGRYLDEIFEDAEEVISVHKRIASSGNLHYWRRSIQNTIANWAPTPYERLSMPLRDRDGDVGHILSIVIWPHDRASFTPDLNSRAGFDFPAEHDGVLVSAHHEG